MNRPGISATVVAACVGLALLVGACTESRPAPTGVAGTPAVPSCSTSVIGIPPDSANAAGGLDLGHALSETFHAAHTDIRSVSIWRIASQAGFVTKIRVYVMGLDSLGVPDPHRIIQNGPSVQNTGGDGTQPTEFKFEFDPPLVLPDTGDYAVGFHSDPCDWRNDVLIRKPAAGTLDLYPDGHMWDHFRTREAPCPPLPNPDPYPDLDLVFSITFCVK